MHDDLEIDAPADAYGLPVELPYSQESLAATSAFVYVWSLPRFQRALAATVEKSPDLAVHQLMRELLLLGPLKPSQVADRFGFTRSAASKVINRAELRGLVTRTPDPDDGRGTLLTMTTAGEILGRRTMEVGDEMMRELTRDWSNSDIETWVTLSRRLSAATAEYARGLMKSAEEPG